MFLVVRIFQSKNQLDHGFCKTSKAGVEFGGRGSFKLGGRFGVFFQMGVAAILSIQDDFENEFFGHEDTPPVILSFGVGLSWSSKKYNKPFSQ